MNTRAPEDTGANGTAADLRGALKALEEAVPRLRDASDLAGLELVQTEAEALAGRSSGRARRKAERIAQKASLVTADLRRNGVETDEEREAREAQEARQARWEEQELRTKLLDRMVTLLHLMLGGTGPEEGVAVLRDLAMADDDGYLRIEIPDVFRSSSPLLIRGYKGSREIFAEIYAKVLETERATCERALRRIAVIQMSAGAEVRGLSTDAVPLVAYSLFSGKLPCPVDASASSTEEKVDDLLLSIADEVSAMPVDARPTFIGLFRLAVLLGEAQAYAEQLSLTSLSFSR